MPDTSLEFIAFYQELRRSFPRIDSMPVWKNVDLLEGGIVHYQILSEVGMELTKWVDQGNVDDALALLEVMEATYVGSITIRSPIYTDFVPALITYDDSESRIKVRFMLKPALAKAYSALLRSYGNPSQTN